jgi:hypothetical protein
LIIKDFKSLTISAMQNARKFLEVLILKVLKSDLNPLESTLLRSSCSCNKLLQLAVREAGQCGLRTGAAGRRGWGPGIATEEKITRRR